MSTPAWKKKARQEALAKEKLDRRYQKLFSSSKTIKKEFIDYVPKERFVRETKEYKSLQTVGSIAAKQEAKQYSGDYIVGLATMHKSNIVPVGREQNPVDFSTMRRN